MGVCYSWGWGGDFCAVLGLAAGGLLLVPPLLVSFPVYRGAGCGDGGERALALFAQLPHFCQHQHA